MFSIFLSENYFVCKRPRFDINAHRLKKSNLSALWRLISKKNCLNFQLLDIFNWLCKGKIVTSWWKFENELWSFISLNGERSENDQKIFYFGILVPKNSIFHDKFNHIFHFSVRWLFNEILKLFYSFKFWAWENFGVVTLCLRSLCSTSLSAWYLTLRRRMMQTRWARPEK